MILWISTLYLISGPACCSDVVGYSGGSVLMFSGLQWDVNHIRYVCKVEQSGCIFIIKDETNRKVVNAGRFKMYANSDDEFLLLIRELNPQDSAVYRFVVGNESNKYIELTVQTDSCCGRIEKMNAYLGETATFTCNYPDEFKTNNKHLLSLNDQTTFNDIIYTKKDSQMEQEDRYSIFDDRRSKVFSVKISGVREDDGGVYLCGVWKYQSVGYYSYVTQIQLQVTEKLTALPESPSTTMDLTTATTHWTTSASPATVASADGHFSSSLIISVGVCGALLLIGGAALIIYKLRNHMRQGSVYISQRTAKYNTDDDDVDVYENVQHGKRCRLNMGPIHKSFSSNPKRSNLVYENFDSNTNQSDSGYEKIVIDPNQSDSEYEKIVRSGSLKNV